jgi:hypothetical protein
MEASQYTRDIGVFGELRAIHIKILTFIFAFQSDPPYIS